MSVAHPPLKLWVACPGGNPGFRDWLKKNLEAMGEINGWSGIERLIPNAQKAQMMTTRCSTASGPPITHDGDLNGIIMIDDF